ncbi:hypothetical protein HanIR_Chr15g0751461 [Helianthus annuus]|nr:hypothetical protein HanIR_Chr15g0751461 [Helianthus annuus]
MIYVVRDVVVVFGLAVVAMKICFCMYISASVLAMKISLFLRIMFPSIISLRTLCESGPVSWRGNLDCDAAMTGPYPLCSLSYEPKKTIFCQFLFSITTSTTIVSTGSRIQPTSVQVHVDCVAAVTRNTFPATLFPLKFWSTSASDYTYLMKTGL